MLAHHSWTIDWYRKLIDSKQPAVRAGALMRTARVVHRTGRNEEARAAYTQLAAIPDARIAGVPAELVARRALCQLSGSKPEAAVLKADLSRARYRLTRGQFDKPLAGKPQLHAELQWQGEPEAFTRSPFMLTVKTDAVPGLAVEKCIPPAPVRKR